MGKKMTRMKQQGFTLIELVVVITILGILAGIALPKFAAMQTHARIAKLNGALGAMKGAAAMAHGLLITKGFPADYTGTPVPNIVIEGTTAVYANGYPDDSVIAELSGITSPDYVIDVSTDTQEIIRTDAGHASCRVIYMNALAGFQPTYDITGVTEANCS